MGAIPIILTVIRIVVFLITEGPELFAMIKELIGWIRGMGDSAQQLAVALELRQVADETVADWKAGERSGRRLRAFRDRLAQRLGKVEPQAPPRRRKGGANA